MLLDKEDLFSSSLNDNISRGNFELKSQVGKLSWNFLSAESQMKLPLFEAEQ